MNFKKVLAVLLVGGLLFGGFAPFVSMAEESTTTTLPTPQNQGYKGGLADYKVSIRAEVAKVLKLTEEQVYQERLAGNSLAEIAAKQNVSKDTLVAEILKLRKAQLDKAVQDGVITQARADYMYEAMKARVETQVERKEIGPVNNKANQMKGKRGGNSRQTNRGQGYQMQSTSTNTGL